MPAGVGRQERLRHGAECLPGGGVRFHLWAPVHPQIVLEVDGRPMSMRPDSNGWHDLDVLEADAGAKYLFQLPDGTKVPDPASRFQPEDVHGPSEVIDASSTASHPFAEGSYEPLRVEGEDADEVIAFVRRSERNTLLVVAARYPARRSARGGAIDALLQMPEALKTTVWHDVLADRRVDGFNLTELLGRGPVGVFLSK